METVKEGEIEKAARPPPTALHPVLSFRAKRRIRSLCGFAGQANPFAREGYVRGGFRQTEVDLAYNAQHAHTVELEKSGLR